MMSSGGQRREGKGGRQGNLSPLYYLRYTYREIQP